MLNTTPQALLEIIEDNVLAWLMDEVADEEKLEGEYARAYYEELLSGVGR
jgi:hypothetical protein